MGYTPDFLADAPGRAEVEALPGSTLLEFGAPWCGHCQRAQASIAAALGAHAGLRHLKVEDGPGRPLGRSFRVKLWPTLILLRDGAELGRVVRPDGRAPIDALLAELGAGGS